MIVEIKDLFGRFERRVCVKECPTWGGNPHLTNRTNSNSLGKKEGGSGNNRGRVLGGFNFLHNTKSAQSIYLCCFNTLNEDSED